MEEVREEIPGMGERQVEYCRFIARLSGSCGNGQKKPEVWSENLDFNVALSLLKENKVPLAYINNRIRGVHPEFLDFPEFRKECEKEQNLNRSLRDEWARVREEFLTEGIETILIKSAGAFPYESSNLDVLIRQNERQKAESILKELGYIQLHNVEEPYKTLFRTFTEGKSNLAIHLHNKVAWINPFHDEGLLWTRYRRSATDDLVDGPSPEDTILILTAHWLYEDKKIKLSDIMKISSCLKKGDLNWEYMKEVAQKRGWLSGFYFGLLVQSFIEKKLLGKSSIDETQLEKIKAKLPRWMRVYFNRKIKTREIVLAFKLPKMFGKFLHFVKTVRDKTTNPSRKLYELYQVAYGALFATLFYKFKINIRHQEPMLISISGVDGSGKTTYAQILYDILTFCELRTRFTWSRVGSSNFLKPFSKMAKIFYSLKERKDVSEFYGNSEVWEDRRKDLFGKSSITRIFGLFILLLEMLLQYFLKVKIPLFFKKVVICDRYIYDTLVEVSTRYGVNLYSIEGKLFRRILTALTPEPDLAYVLLIPVMDACKRREVGFKGVILIQEQIELYKEISSMYNLEQIRTDNNESINKISDKMIQEILTKYYSKWESSK